MTFAFAKALRSTPATKRGVGGDDGVERDSKGRPRIRTNCTDCQQTGREPGARPGTTRKCQSCKGEGHTVRSFTRVTTIAGMLDDTSNIADWRQRMTLVGIARDTGLLKDVLSMDPDDKEDKNILSRRAEAAAELAGAGDKAAHGDRLHLYTEAADKGEPLPDDITTEDLLDVQAYMAATTPLLDIDHVEQLVVNDLINASGTPDRISHPKPGVVLIAPDGTRFTSADKIITDLKTGRIDLGALKMTLQLSIYSRSNGYNKETGERFPIDNVSKKWGIIMHLPPGEAKCELLWTDLEIGWTGVMIAMDVRAARRQNRLALVPFNSESIEVTAAA